jgi:predicted NBD/HSP70 family sugar kinase
LSEAEAPAAAGSTYRTASTGLTRDLNRAAIFRLIGSSGPIARTQIARRLGLSPATVTAVTRELLDRGIVRVAERAPSRRGRPALLLEVVGGAAAAFGIKLAPDHVVGVRVDLEAEVQARFEESFDATEPGAPERLADVLARWLDGTGSTTPLLGLGVGVSGVVDSAEGRIDSPMLGWRNVPLAELLRERLRLPVLVDNDVNTLAIAERLYGRGRESDNFVTVTIGRGVGLGIVAGGDIYRGFRGGAGELGHTTAVVDGATCRCGKRGCLETVVGDPALVAEGRRCNLLGPDDGIEQLRRLADEGNRPARHLFADAGAALGRAVADVSNLLSPQLVLVSGEGTQAWQHLASAFEASFRANLFAPLDGIVVEVDPWDDAKWAVGAATLVLRASFAAPLDEDRPSTLRMGVVA